MINKTPRNVIVAWCKPGQRLFEENIPLLYNGQHNLELGSNNPITVVFLSGMKYLSKDYLKGLRATGYTIVNAEKTYNKIASRYSCLDRYGQTEKYWFLRWLVLDTLFKREPIIHYDGDIVWNATPEKIATIVKNKTFVLSGGPAFTVISDPKWFKVYKSGLNKFCNVKEDYAQDWRGTQFRNKIGHDQDLIEYLLQKELLPQDSVPGSQFEFIENPIGLKQTLYRKMAFWHMQTDFVHYLNLMYMLEPYGLSRFVPNPLTTPRLILRFIYLLGRLAGRGYQSRLNIYKYFLAKLV